MEHRSYRASSGTYGVQAVSLDNSEFCHSAPDTFESEQDQRLTD